jgi:hypothetical protein
MLEQRHRGLVGDEQHGRSFGPRGHCCLHCLPACGVKGAVSDGLDEGSEAIGVLRLRFGANLLPGVFASEVRADQ